MTDPNAIDWELVCSPGAFRQLRRDPSFQKLVALARTTNSLRFTHQAITTAGPSQSLVGLGQRLSAVLYMCALLFEGLRLSQTLGRYYKDRASFREGFALLHSDEEVASFRRNVLEPLRNKAVFHLDQDAVRDGLLAREDDDEVVFARGTGAARGQTYYQLADEAVARFLVGCPSNGNAFKEGFIDLLNRSTKIAVRFGTCADSLIWDVLKRGPWAMRRPAR